MSAEELKAFLASHVVNGDGRCSCGWDVENYDRPDRGFGLGQMTVADAWEHHVQRASYDAFRAPKDQYVETVGPDGELVVFELKRSSLLHSARGMMAEYVQRRHAEYGYQFDDYEPPERDPDGLSRPISCEEANCRDPYCLGGHISISLSFPKICAGCSQPLGDEPSVGIVLRPRNVVLEEDTAVATTVTYHERCQPTDEELQEHAREVWPEPEPADSDEYEPRQAMACLSCGLAGETPEEHYPQPAGLWDRPCPECGAMMVWVTEPSDGG